MAFTKQKIKNNTKPGKSELILLPSIERDKMLQIIMFKLRLILPKNPHTNTN